jgi:hypothetical protein
MLSYENQLLLSSTYVKHSPSSHQYIAGLLQHPLDWDEVVAAASWYAIKPLLYRCLRDNPEKGRVPALVIQQLKKAYDDITLRNMYIYATLARVLPLFKQQGIKCIVLKGAMLADTVYGDIGLRPMQDIDLLFHKEDLPAAIAIVTGLGYHHEGSNSPQFYLDTHHHITYTNPDTDIPMELHWHISHERHPIRLRVTDEALITRWYERVQPVTLSRVEAWTLCPTDLLFHLCLHFLKHRVPKNGELFATSAALLQFSDIVRTIYYYGDGIDWDDLRHQAEKYRISDLIHTTIKIAMEVCVYKDGRDRLEVNISNGRYRYKKLMYKRLMLHEDMTNPIPEGILDSVTVHNLRGIMRAVVRWLLPAKQTLAEKYAISETDKKMYLYFLINPLNLIRTILVFIRQMPRLSEEIRLHKWIGGRYQTNHE